MTDTLEGILAEFNGEWGPLDYLSLAGRERLHSEAMRWLFVPQSPYKQQRSELLALLLGEPLHADVQDATSEFPLRSGSSARRLDLWIGLRDGTGVAIENKLCALESPGQCHEMGRLLDGRAVRRIFLSLTGARPGCQQWVPVNYERLLRVIEHARQSEVDRSGFTATYEGTLRRLVRATELVRREPEQVGQIVFDTKASPGWEEFGRYVEQMRLRRALQAVWLEQLIERIPPPEGWTAWEANESRGNALVETARYVRIDGCEVRVGLQLQRGSPKAFLAPSHYHGRPKHPSNMSQVIEREVIAIKSKLNSPATISSDRGRGFRSFPLFQLRSWLPTRWQPQLEDALVKLTAAAAEFTSGTGPPRCEHPN